MNAYKPRLFIGSSKEGLAIAEQIRDQLSDVTECKMWLKQFKLGNAAYEDLLRQLSLFDYGLLIATSDDITYSRKTKKKSPRDNIIFEFGLFAGRLGKDRAFLVAESGIKLPSDLNGITLSFIPKATSNSLARFFFPGAAKRQEKKIYECCKGIKDHIAKRNTIFDFGFLPSTSLAYGYFNNFVLKAVSNLLESKKLKLTETYDIPKQAGAGVPNKIANGLAFTDVSFTVLIPDGLSADMFDHVKQHRAQYNWELIKIDAGSFRPFDFYIQADESVGGVLQLSDIPLTLNALGESIRAYVGKSYVGISEAERLLEIRELLTFKSVLDHLISENPITKDRVRTELVAK